VPCCTLVAFVLSQLGLGAVAARVRVLGRRIPLAWGGSRGGWKALGFAVIAAFEILLASAALPLIATERGRAEAAQSFRDVKRICSVGLRATDWAAPRGKNAAGRAAAR